MQLEQQTLAVLQLKQCAIVWLACVALQSRSRCLCLRAGQWCFPGGSLELGETLAECAIRETLEETGLRLRSSPPPPEEVYSDDLSFPTPIAAADGIFRDAGGRGLWAWGGQSLAAMAAARRRWLTVHKALLQGLSTVRRLFLALAEVLHGHSRTAAGVWS